VNPLTAFGMLEDLNPPPDSWVIQTAAGSVLGRMFANLAERRGVNVINVIRRTAQKAELEELGYALLNISQSLSSLPGC
jgi:NADPH:quinone reductase-like Zn-dependent oxidoreductase